jgi:heptosyltransferase III
MKRTLVVRGGALGDFLLTLPALQALRLANVTLVTRPSYSALLRALGWEHIWVNLESSKVAALFQHNQQNSCTELEWLAEFDEIYAWMTDADGQFHRNVQTAGGRNFTLLNPIVSNAGNHASQQLANGLNVDITPVRWPQPPAVLPFPEHLAIHPGSGSLSKNWPVDYWLELMRRLASVQPNLSFLIVAGEADERPLQQMKSALKTSPLPVTWAENLPLPELASALAGCVGYLGHDTGITHLAASLDLRTLALFGPTDPAIWAPLGNQVQVLRAPLGNLTELSVDEVWAQWCAMTSAQGH